METQRYRVYNKCKFDIGITLENGQQIVVKAGSFQLMKTDDIIYVESICSHVPFFAKRWLVPYDSNGKEVSYDQLGVYITPDEHPHMSDQEIEAMFKKSAKQVKAWIAEIDDPIELHAIASVAKKMNLTADKLRAVQDKVPEMDMRFEDEEEKIKV